MDILSITGPIYLAIAVGYGATRAGWFQRSDLRVLGQFVFQVALPALLFNALSQRPLANIVHMDYLGAYLLGSLGLLLPAWWLLRHGAGHSASLSACKAMGMSNSNSGYVGYPIAMLLMGAPNAGVVLALNMLVENLFILPLALALADLDGSVRGATTATGAALTQSSGWLNRLRWLARTLGLALKGMVRNPLVLAIVAGMAVSLTGVVLPSPVTRTVHLFAQASGALALFVIGGNMVGLQVRGLIRPVALIAVGKLVLHPALMALVVFWLVPVADPVLRTGAVLMACMPMLGIYPILSQKHGHEGLASAALLATTVASFFTISAVLALMTAWPALGVMHHG
jgi:malonate transporter and related proteins